MLTGYGAPSRWAELNLRICLRFLGVERIQETGGRRQNTGAVFRALLSTVFCLLYSMDLGMLYRKSEVADNVKTLITASLDFKERSKACPSATS